jgi:high-affinity nickel permease
MFNNMQNIKKILLFPIVFFAGSCLLDVITLQPIIVKKNLILSLYYSIIIIPFILLLQKNKKK